MSDEKQNNIQGKSKKVLNERGLFGLKGKIPDSVKNKPSIKNDPKKKD